jgi:hypothetical protein
MRRVAVIRVLALLSVAVVVTAVGLLLYQPLGRGSIATADQVGLIDSSDGNADEPPSYTYRYAPGAEYFTAFTIRNNGSLPVTLIGPDQSHGYGSTPDVHAVLWADEFRIARGEDELQDFEEDPRGALSAVGAVIGAGNEVAIWVHWKMGGACPDGRPAYMPGTAAGRDRVDVNWSIFGIPRTSTIDLGYTVWSRNPPDDPLLTCAT